MKKIKFNLKITNYHNANCNINTISRYFCNNVILNKNYKKESCKFASKYNNTFFYLKKTYFSDYFKESSTSSKIYQEDDLIFDISKPEKFRGMLIICPTPIGNLNDISIRQYEALKTADILACEDTRMTSKLLELINKKKMQENFYMEFGITIDEFVNAGGLDMSDEQIEERFLKKNKAKKSDESNNSNTNDKFNNVKESNDSHTENDKDAKLNQKNNPNNNANYYEFYHNNEDIVKKGFINNNIEKLNNREKQVLLNKHKQSIEVKELTKKESINNIENKLFTKFNIREDTYDQVRSKSDFESKKQLILEEDMEEEFENLAETYSKNKNLSYILKAKARYIINSASNRFQNKAFKQFYENINNDENEDKNSNDKKDDLEYLDVEYGLEDNYFIKFKQRIKDEKIKKGRGILFRYKDEVEEKSTKTLVRAMKLGLKVALLSDAGTPTISDPGYKLVSKCIKEKITVESIPGPCALITAISASGLPTDKFIFLGYVPKGVNNKKEFFSNLKNMKVTGVIYESPLRVVETLESIISVFEKDQKVFLANELTKINEKHIHGTAKEVLDEVNKLNSSEVTYLRGEVTIVIAPPEVKEDIKIGSSELKELGYNTEINVVDVAKKIDKLFDMNFKELKSVLCEVFNVPKVRAQKIANIIRSDSKDKDK
jgi:16S rRNA (cytidine1402-2'-O)-methyltransferase